MGNQQLSPANVSWASDTGNSHSDDGVILADAEGTISLVSAGTRRLIRVPSATEIFRAAVRGDPVAFQPALAKPPSETCPDVTFWPVPAELILIIDSPQGSPLHASLEVELEGHGRISVHSGTTGPDHILYAGIWTPFQPDLFVDLANYAESANIHIPGPLSLVDYGQILKIFGPEARIESKFDPHSVVSAVDNPPTGFKGELLPFQKEGYAWLSFCLDSGIGCILADEMGLGKTIQIISVIQSAVEKALRPHLIVVPATILENWRRELACFAPSLKVRIHSGPQRTGDPAVLTSEDVVVMSWATMVRDLSLLEGVNWAGVFLDEAQFAKNPSTIRATSATTIPARATFPVTGTPLENRLLDLCTLLSIAAPAAFGDPAKTAAHWGAQASRFGELCAPFLLRRTVDRVAKDLPPLVSCSEALAMLPSEAKHYKEIQAESSRLDRKSNALAAITRLRRFCAHPSLDGIASDDAASISQKYTRLCELVSKLVESGEKAIIGSPWKALSELMVIDLPRRFDVFLALIDGRTPLEERQTIVDRFSKHSGPAVLILAPRAAGLGLNITAARHVIQYVPDWNPAVQDQLTARAHRKGQANTVFEHRLFYEGTVEEAAELLLAEKRTLAAQAVIESKDKQRDVSRVFDMSLRMKPKAAE